MCHSDSRLRFLASAMRTCKNGIGISWYCLLSINGHRSRYRRRCQWLFSRFFRVGSKPAHLGVLLSFCFHFSEASLQFSVILSCLNGVVLRSTEHFEALVRKHVTIIKSEPYPTKNLLPRNFNQRISNETRTSTNFCYID